MMKRLCIGIRRLNWTDCYEELSEFEKAGAVWEEIAQDLKNNGYDIESEFPSKQAKLCADRVKKHI